MSFAIAIVYKVAGEHVQASIWLATVVIVGCINISSKE